MTAQWTALVDGEVVLPRVRQVDGALWVEPDDFALLTNWQVKEQTLCREDRCLPLAMHPQLQDEAGCIDLAAFAALQQVPLAVEEAQHMLSLGTAVDDHALLQADAIAPDFTLPDRHGVPHSLSDYRGRKVLLVVWASWCGCREDLPVWQALHDELQDQGLTVITIAQDARLEDAAPHIEAASPVHPSLVDRDHIVSQRYGFINVPTVVWINEEGRIVRPPRVEHGSNQFQFVHKLDCEPHLIALRHWVRTGETDCSQEETASQIPAPTYDEQLARAEQALAWHLYQKGEQTAATLHWEKAIALSPHDWTIRRGSMWLRGEDPFGMDFFKVWEEWEQAGKPDYNTMAARRTNP